MTVANGVGHSAPTTSGRDLRALLRELITVEHVRGGLIVAPDGLLIASELPSHIPTSPPAMDPSSWAERRWASSCCWPTPRRIVSAFATPCEGRSTPFVRPGSADQPAARCRRNVRNVIEYRSVFVGETACCHADRAAPPST